MENRNYVTVEELNRYLANLILDDTLLANPHVLGEISGLSYKGNNAYFTLKDNSAQISVNVWSSARLKSVLKEGEKVIVIGSVEYYEKGGRINLIARHVEKFGEGDASKALEELKAKLKAEGLFEEGRKRPLPRYPLSVAIVTSAEGAVISDILTTIRAVNTVTDLTLIDTKVQGDQAPASLVKAIETADKLGAEVIIIARGGGSKEDLSAFDTEAVARAVANCKTPTISAVGHESDFSVCDLVADHRAPTPTAGAKLVGFSTEELIANIANTMRIIQAKAENSTGKIERLIVNLLNNQAYAITAKLAQAEQKISVALSAIEQKNPLKILVKGYFELSKAGVKIPKISNLAVNDKIQITALDGTAEANITKITLNPTRRGDTLSPAKKEATHE